MIKETAVINKTQRYKNYKPSGVKWLGEIPEHWEVLPLFALTKLKSITNNNGLELLSVYLDRGVIRFSDVTAKRTNVTSLDLSKYQLVEPGDFVINNQQAWRGSVGVSNYSGIVSPAYIVLSLSNDLNPIFANYLFRDSSMVSQYLINSKGVGTIQRNLYWPSLRRSSISLPPLQEQTAIAQFLDAKTTKIDEAIAIKQQQIALLKERKQILVHKAVTRGLNKNVTYKDSGVEWIGAIPEHWEVRPLRHIGKTQNGLSKGGEYFGTGFPFLTYSDVYNNRGIPEKLGGLAETSYEERKQFSVKKGDVFFTRTSETVDDIGFSSTCFKSIENGTFAGFLIRFRPKENILDTNFSKFYFSSSTHRPFFIGQMNLVIRASLSQDHLKKMPVLLPPLSEQKEIANYIETASTKIETAISLKEQEIEKLKEYKRSLINSVVTGKVRVC